MSIKAARRDPREVHVELEDRLRREGRHDLADILVKCRTQLQLECLCCGDRFLVDKGCRKRWCPVCGPMETARRYDRIAPIASRMQWPLSVMLSMANPKDVAGCVRKLKAAFKGFRRTAFWRAAVKGGFVGFEITHGGNGAHVHLHALVDCEWLAVSTPRPQRGHTRAEIARLCEMAQRELSAVWAGYLGQATAQVWVRRADRKALKETIKYPIKPSDLLDLKCLASEVIDELAAGRNVASFGNCHSRCADFLGRPEPEPKEHLCKACLTDRSVVPSQIVSGWFDGRGSPTKRQGDLLGRTMTAADCVQRGGKPPRSTAVNARSRRN